MAAESTNRLRPGVLPGLLLLLTSLGTIVWLAPGLPVVGQDSAWAFALNQAVAQRLAFGRDVLFNLGPWAAVYTGQYHPATDGMMLFGGTVVASGLAAGLLALARGWRRWVALLAPLLVATVKLNDPVFVAFPLLLLTLAVYLATPPRYQAAVPRDWPRVAALLLLVAGCALLSLVKSTFGTEALPMIALALLALCWGGAPRLALAAAAIYLTALLGFWLAAGQRLSDLPGYFAAIPLLISGYTEGLAKTGPISDISAYGCGAALLVALVWLDRARLGLRATTILLAGLLFTLFVAFKSGFVRHDEHALIAAGSLAISVPVLASTLRARSLALAAVATLVVLGFISHHYPRYPWPYGPADNARLANIASGTWSRLTDLARLHQRFDAQMAQIRANEPLPPVQGPTDTYSSGQTTLLANGLQWSPRPALQSTTATSPGIAQADLDHLRRVQNVFYTVESEDNRLPTTEDGLSWPTLLSEFRAASFDRGADAALLIRQPGTRTVQPAEPPLFDETHPLGPDVPLPVIPGGLAWAKLDIRPTLLGRLTTLLFRPPALFLTLRYADGPVERVRLLSDLARAGFLLTPHVSTTEEMLLLLTAERRRPEHRLVSLALSGESGTSWLWNRAFTLQLSPIDIPVQDQVAAMLLTIPHPSALADPAETQAACHIDYLGTAHTSPEPMHVTGSLRVSGWAVTSPTAPAGPDQIRVHLTDAAGRTWEAPASLRLRPDVAGYLVNPKLVRSGFDVRVDLSALSGPVTLGLATEQNGQSHPCTVRQELLIAPAAND